MEISFIQRTGLFLIQSAIKLIWLFDWFKDFPQKFIYGTIKFVFIIYFAFLLTFLIFSAFSNSSTSNFSNNISRGLVTNLYGYSPTITNLSSSTAVLGAASNNVPALVHTLNLPAITATSVLIVDANTQKTLFSLNSSSKRAPASTTKLMTALIAKDLYSLEETVKVPIFCTQNESQSIGLPDGEEFKVKDLLYSLLISSAGDAACTLAAGKIPATEFVAKMNERAQELGMTRTFFVNPIGLDGVDSTHFSTAEDLYKLSQASIADKLIRDIVSTKAYQVDSLSEKFTVSISNTNKLLWDIPNTVGIKTGTTEEAGEVLIYEYQDDLKNLVIIVMGSQNRFYDTQALLSWILRSYSW